MLRYKYLLSVFLLMMTSFMSISGAKNDDTPDFAYPQTVISDATKSLAEATNGADRLRAVLEICAAKASIDPDSMFALPAFVEAQMEAPGLTDADKAMFTAYEAQLFRNIYNNNRFKYNNVDAPDEPVPADISLWSGKQFRRKIETLYASAASLAAADNAPLTDYTRCLNYNDYILPYIPDLRGFVALRTFNWFDSLNKPYAQESKKALAETASGFYGKATAPWFYWRCEYDDTPAALVRLYDEYSDNEAARYVLMDLCEKTLNYNYEVPDDTRTVFRDKIISFIENSLVRFPDWFGNETLSEKLASLTRPIIDIHGPSLCAPDKIYNVSVKTSFVKDYTLTLYRLTSSGKYIPVKKIASEGSMVSVTKKSISATDTTMTVGIKISAPGHYALLPSLPGIKCESPAAIYFEAVLIIPVLVNGVDNKGVIVADFTTGAPVTAAVDLNLSSWRSGTEKKTKYLGNTGRDGVLMFSGEDDNKWQNQTLSFKYRNRTYKFRNEIQLSENYGGNESNDERILVFTDRPIYHPGDTIAWAAVAAVSDKTLEGRSLKVTVRDANGQIAGTTTAVTDAYGRVSGKFVTQKGVLTGYWRLTAVDGKKSGTATVMVSDFRVPTFSAEVTSVERDVPAKGSVRLSGSATTYSGMPVAGADVKITVSGASRWRWFYPARELGTLDAKTDASGAFTFDIPADILAQPFDNGKPYTDFSASVVVTATDGSASETTKNFTTGKPYVLEVSAPQTTVDTSAPAAVNFKAYDANGKEVSIAVNWSLRGEGSNSGEAMRGVATTGKTSEIDLSRFGAGRFRMTVEPVDTVLANPTDNLILTLYNVDKGQIPADSKIFVPVTTISAGEDVLVGVNVDKAYIYVVQRQGKKLEKIRLHTLSRGYHRIPAVVGDPENAQLLLTWVLGEKVENAEIDIRRPETKLPEVKAESFRDRLTPGNSETWRFRLLDADGKALDAAMIATLYNRALEELEQPSVPVNFGFYKPSYNIWLNTAMPYGVTASARKLLKKSIKYYFVYPTFLFENYYSLGSIRIGGLGRATAKYAANAAPDLLIVEDEVASMDSGVAESIEEGKADGGTQPQDAGQFEYREGEALQGFWEPSLVSDKDGNIDITFTVPNAIGSWRINAFAWSKNTDAARFIGECLANKPVMVQPNLPRFLRQGDKARVLATVYNNSDTATDVTTTVEIFDVATGNVIGTSTSTEHIAAKGSALAAIDVTAPVDASSLGYRVRSQAGQFADGEQTLIPILSSSTTVIESTEFYLNPGDKRPFEFTMKNPKDASLTLQYCQNPVWTAVKAMRGIAGQQPSTSSALVSKIFSALAAKKIVGGNKDISAAIAQWRDNPSEHALTSMLERNEALKRLLLDQTPWLQTASNESQRMAALCQLLDPVQTDASLRTSVTAMLKLRNADGGFAWTSWAEKSSVWSTENILTTLGIANSLGMLPADSKLNDILQPAFNYLAAEAQRYGMPDTDRSLALIAALLPQLDTNRAAALIDRTLADVAASWKKGDVVDKAWSVILLEKKQPAVAAEILESIRQFGVVRPGQGMCFPSISDIRGYATIIQAYSLMKAPAADIDAMRQWVIVQAQANDDFGTYNPDYIVAALLMTGSEWTSVPVAQNVTVDGKPLEIGAVESSTGYFCEPINGTGSKITVSVQPNGVTPSYGSVIAISRQPMTKVKARAGRDLSIEKRVLVQRDGQWIETNSFALGERVRVQLTIVAKRDLEYVSIDDERPATFEPVEQLPGYVWDGGTSFYRENLDASTRLFISWLGKGSYHITYDMTANVAGSFTSGIATLQSQLAPELTAHSGSAAISVE